MPCCPRTTPFSSAPGRGFPWRTSIFRRSKVVALARPRNPSHRSPPDLLPYSLLNSLHMDVDQARYNSFVKSLQDTVRGSTADAASQRAPSPWPMDDDDAEFDNPENLAEGEEAEVENFAVPRDEIEALLRENADFLASLGLESVVDNVPSNAWAGSTGQKIFTEQQIATLKTQMTQNFQIVTQAYAIQSALHGPQSNDAGIWRHQLQLMKTDGEWAQKLARTQQRENSHFWLPGLALVPKILQMPVDQAAPKAAVFIQKFAYPYTRKEIAKYRTKLEKEAEGAKTKEARGGRKELILPESVQKTIDMCKGVFVPELVPQIIRMRKGRLIMMPEEDSLLALGIFKFGSDDWNEIQAYCLPTRTSKQLKARHKNLVCRRGPDNEVKRMHLNQVQPLKLIEKELLITGVREYGPAFRNVVDRVFPRFPKALISRTWDSLHASEQVPCSFGESASAAPTPCDEGPVVAPSSDVILCRHGETDHYTIAGAGLEYIEINLRLLLKERGLPGKDVRSRLSKNLLHAVIGGKTYSLNSTCRVGPREPPNVPVVAKRKQDMFDFLAEQRKKRIRV
ncbi:hypothetical protein DFJ74DRAFT_672120 [Hyaloraphidium curvatum]|nr:hypothetical protein DFJ74DRAFT_672120 [Hyaloraphidium curvatum]